MNKPLLPLVRASAVVPFVDFLGAAGAPVDRYLAAARLSPQFVERAEALLPLHQALKFIDRAAAGQRVENLGCLVGDCTEIAQLGALGRVIQRSMTLSGALITVAESIHLYNSGDRIWVHPEQDQVLFCHAFTQPGTRGANHGNLFTLRLMIKVIRLAAGAQWCPREIRVPRTEEARRKYYEAEFHADVVFHGHDAYAVAVERPLLVRPLKSSENGEVRESDDAAFLRSTAPAPDLGGSLQQAIGGMLRSGYPDVRLVAESAGLSVRTLQRRLTEEGLSYSLVVNRVRFETAVRLLRDDHIKLIDIAYELGYTDAANFTRAFRDWAGVPPSEYRRRHA